MTVKKKTVKSTRVEQQMRKKLDKVNVQHLTEKKKSLEMISMDSAEMTSEMTSMDSAEMTSEMTSMDSAEMTSEMTSMVNDVEVQKRKTRSKAEGDSYAEKKDALLNG